VRLKDRWSAWKEQAKFKYVPRVANWLLDLATKNARSSLAKSGPISILLDNTVLYHGVTHETVWVSTGTKKWGGVHEFESGYAARVPVHPRNDGSREYENTKFLPALAHLARLGHIRLLTSAELGDEEFRQPAGRYSGYGMFDHSVFSGLPIESVDGRVFPNMGPEAWDLPTPAEQQRSRLAASDDAFYRSMVGVMGGRNSQDAWHIATAERHGLFCFLTMDWKLLRTLDAVKSKEPVRSLRTRVMTPKQLGEHLSLVPFPTFMLSYDDASFPVRADLSLPEGKRTPLKAYQKTRR
jgi:hypothetical protein